MEKKLWSNAEVVELGVESTEVAGCPINFEISQLTNHPTTGQPCNWGYEPISGSKKCKFFDDQAPGQCKKQLGTVIS